MEQCRRRLLVKDYAQKECIEFIEKFFLMVRLMTIRVVLTIYVTFDLHLEQLDVKTTFLLEKLKEEICMLQPEGLAEMSQENLVCRLNKSLYSLKQVLRCWYKRFNSFIISLGYNKLNSDHCVY